MPKRIDVLMFSAATAAIMHCYSDGKGRHRDVFRSKYLNVLDFVFGNTGMHICPSLCDDHTRPSSLPTSLQIAMTQAYGRLCKVACMPLARDVESGLADM